MSRVKEFSIAREFTAFPGGRTRQDGPYNGARFRDDVLKPLLAENDEVILDLDGLAGLPSSFWEEVFGGLIRKAILTVDQIGKHMEAHYHHK